MKNKRKSDDPPAKADELAKRKLMKLQKLGKKADSPEVIAIKQKAAQFIESKQNANNFVDLIAKLDVTESPANVKATIQAVKRVLFYCLDSGSIDLKSVDKEKESTADSSMHQYRIWLEERAEESCRRLCELVHHPESSVSHLAVVTTLNIMHHHDTMHGLGKSWSEPATRLFTNLLLAIFSNKRSGQVPLVRLQEYVVNFMDVKHYFIQRLSKIMDKAIKGNRVSPVFVENVLVALEALEMTKFDKADKVTSFLCHDPQGKGSTYKPEPDHMKKSFSKLWLDLLKQDLKTSQYKRILVVISEKVMPFLVNPLLLTDFLLASYNVGGSISMLALSGVFQLITKHNLEYPDFYDKLYALLTPEVFFVKYKARFFYLSDIFLSSTHIPEYLVAAFIKRLARKRIVCRDARGIPQRLKLRLISLQAPANCVEMCIRFIHNLMHRHRSLERLIHSPDQQHDLETDPYIYEENDPAKCEAVKSSLWEIKTHTLHLLPQVSAAAKDLLEKGVRETEKDISACLEVSWGDMMNAEVKKKIFVNVPLNYEKPNGLQLAKNELLSDIVDIS